MGQAQVQRSVWGRRRGLRVGQALRPPCGAGAEAFVWGRCSARGLQGLACMGSLVCSPEASLRDRRGCSACGRPLVSVFTLASSRHLPAFLFFSLISCSSSVLSSSFSLEYSRP